MTLSLRRCLFATLLLFGAGLALHAQTYYLEIDGIDGESTEAGYEDQICITSFSWEVEREPRTTTGGGASAAQQSQFLLGKELDIASVQLLEGVLSGRLFQSATLSVLSPDPTTGENFLRATYEMRTVSLLKYQPGGEGDTAAREVVALLPEAITYTVFTPRGSKTSTSWNFSTNAPE